MTDNETFFQDAREALKALLQPFRKELNQKQRMADFVNQCIRCIDRDDFLQLDELLKSKPAEQVKAEKAFEEGKDWFERLGADADEKVERYRLQFIDDVVKLATEADLPMDIDFPRFYSLKGIDGEFSFSQRTTTINKTVLKSIDPRRIIAAVLKIKRRLYDRPYEPQTFIDNLYQVYANMIEQQQRALGDTIPIQRFYPEYVMSLQSKVFFQNMDKAKFKGCSLEQFSVDLWRYFQSGIGGTSRGQALQLRPGRNNSLWLIDSDGERRQITGIAFQEQNQ